MLSFDTLKNAFGAQEFFAEKTWQTSPEAFPLTPEQLDEITEIGNACRAFYKAQDLLYARSAQNKKILRNAEVFAPWVAEYLDRGKPAGVIAHARHRAIKNQIPTIIRPDLLVTEKGFALTEMDTISGGIGLTGYLNEIYSRDISQNTVGALSQTELFYESTAALAPGENAPFIAIVISDEATPYRPEFEWIAAKLREQNRRVYCVHPAELMSAENALFAPVNGMPMRVDVIFRFFELFDLGNIKGSDVIFDAVEAGFVAMTPPMKTYQEEKLSLALFHHPALDEYWRENLSPDHFFLLRKIIPKTWVMEQIELPMGAVLHAPWIDGKPIRRWSELANASQKERNLIIKASGFSEKAWGARSVTLGSDVSREEWLAAIEDACDPENETFYVMQEYHKPKRVRHRIYRRDGTVEFMDGRVRLCPYYFVSNETVEIGSILATVCPADKKIIHGMTDAILIPCTCGQQTTPVRQLA